LIELRNGWWWPQGDVEGWRASHGTVGDVEEAVKLCKERRQCIQAGALGGVWPKHLAGFFQEVFTFEPDPVNFECAKRNLADTKNVTLYHCALGAESSGTVGLQEYAPDNRGAGYVYGFGDIPLFRGDDINLNLCDLIVLDVEGYETPALRGLSETIVRCRPVIMLEHKHWGRYDSPDPVEYLRERGYRIERTIHRDVILVPDG
jgi:FkbM family methyltransferase